METTVTVTVQVSLQARIVAALAGLFKEVSAKSIDRSNSGPFLRDMFIWDTIADYAKKQADLSWDKAVDAGVIEDKEARAKMSPGEHTLTESRYFKCIAVVTQPVRRFSVDSLATKLKKQFKVPEATTKELCEASKEAGSPQVRLRVEERA